MKKLCKRCLALWLSLWMIVGLCPLYSFAASGYKNGDIVEFGTYPQTRVTQSVLLNRLEALEKNWVSYGYYTGSGFKYGTAAQSDFMQYADVELNGAMYRAVLFTKPKPDGTIADEAGWQQKNGYEVGTTYYFRYEPLEWEVVDADNDILATRRIIDARAFCNEIFKIGTSHSYYATSTGEYCSNYMRSDIRAFLNKDFLELAIPTEKMEFVASSEIYVPESGSDSLSYYLQDKVYLLSREELQTFDITRTDVGASDYAYCQGLGFYRTSGFEKYGNYWWLRDGSGSGAAYVERGDGDSPYAFLGGGTEIGDNSGTGTYLTHGVRPAIRLTSLDAALHEHSFEKSGTASATCTEEGYERMICSCGEIRKQSIVPPKGHTYEETVIAPTEETGGYTLHTCTACKVTFMDTFVPPPFHTVHDYVYLETIAPTCTEKGYDKSVCSVCREEKQDNFLDATGHRYEVTVVNPTEAADGYTNHICAYCGDSYKDNITPALPHMEPMKLFDGDVVQFGSWPQSRVTDPETLAVLDAMEKTFKTRNKVQYAELSIGEERFRAVYFTETRNENTEPIFPAGEIYYFRYEPLQWVVVDAEKGRLQTLNIIDGEPFGRYDTNTVVDHYTQWLFRNANIRGYLNGDFLLTAFSNEERVHFLRPGLSDASSPDYVYPCYVFLQTTKEPKIITPVYTNDTDYAVCKGAHGLYWSRSESRVSTQFNGVVCIEYKKDAPHSGFQDYSIETVHGVRPCIELDDLQSLFQCPHDYQAQITKQATCTDEGECSYNCTLCGDFFTQTIPAAGHTFEHITESATCTRDGVEYDYCTVCRGKFSETTLQKSGHDYKDTVIQPTEETGGYTKHVCSVCKDEYTDNETEPLPHTTHSLSKQKTVEPTCTEQGYDLMACAKCDYTEKTNFVSAKGHKYEDTVIQPTEEQGGYTKHVCSVCKDEYTDNETDPLSHTVHKYEVSVTVEPTCVDEGYIISVCRICQDQKTEYTTAAGHRFEHIQTIATCEQDGREYDYCTVCKNSYNEIHTPKAHEFQNGSCTKCGRVQFWEYTIRAGVCTITGYTGEEKELLIPDKLENTPVTKIAKEAFAGNAKLEFVHVPDSVLYIDENAFRGCIALREVYLGRNASSLDSGAFANCVSLALVCIDTEDLHMASDAFKGCDKRITFISPDSTKTSAFLKRSSLPSVTYAYPVKRGGDNVIAFKGKLILYPDLDYHYWNVLVDRCAGATYMYFEYLMFYDMDRNTVEGVDSKHIDRSEKFLTFRDVYMSVEVDGKRVTFDRLTELLMNGASKLALTFDNESGFFLRIAERLGAVAAQVFGALTKVINSIIRIFRKK